MFLCGWVGWVVLVRSHRPVAFQRAELKAPRYVNTAALIRWGLTLGLQRKRKGGCGGFTRTCRRLPVLRLPPTDKSGIYDIYLGGWFNKGVRIPTAVAQFQRQGPGSKRGGPPAPLPSWPPGWAATLGSPSPAPPAAGPLPWPCPRRRRAGPARARALGWGAGVERKGEGGLRSWATGSVPAFLAS
jgi:hypothetical protein